MADTGDPESDTGCPLAYRGGPSTDTGNPLANTIGPMADISDSLANMEVLTSDSESPLADLGGPLVGRESLWRIPLAETKTGSSLDSKRYPLASLN